MFPDRAKKPKLQRVAVQTLELNTVCSRTTEMIYSSHYYKKQYKATIYANYFQKKQYLKMQIK